MSASGKLTLYEDIQLNFDDFSQTMFSTLGPLGQVQPNIAFIFPRYHMKLGYGFRLRHHVACNVLKLRDTTQRSS
jgi:hypothetical protein